MKDRRNNEERRRRRRLQRRMDREARAAAAGPPDRWKQLRRLVIVALGLAALGAGGVAAGYGIAAMRAAESPVELQAP